MTTDSRSLANLRSAPITAGDWNYRQKFDARGVLFMIGAATGGGFMVMRVDEAELPNATLVAVDLPTEAEAVAAAERLRKAALT
jgi:hypothetical protein